MLHYVECVNVPDPSTSDPSVSDPSASASSVGVPSVVNVKIMVSVLGYRHANEAEYDMLSE